MPGPTVSMGGMAMCIFGAAPTSIIPFPTSMTMVPTPAATIMSMVPFANVTGCAMCTSPGNPTVIAKLGAPSPCTPMITPWIPTAANVLLGGQPVLTMGDMTMCPIGQGMVTVTMPGEMQVQSL